MRITLSVMLLVVLSLCFSNLLGCTKAIPVITHLGSGSADEINPSPNDTMHESVDLHVTDTGTFMVEMKMDSYANTSGSTSAGHQIRWKTSQ